jgi:hypothetical protein
MTPEHIQKLSSPEAVEQLLAPPQSYGNGYDCCDQQVALAHALRGARAEIEALKGWPDGRCDFCGEPKEIHDGEPAGRSYCDKIP